MNTEPKYIDANKIDWHYIPLAAMSDLYVTKSEVDALPAEDVETIRQGEWVETNDVYVVTDKYECSLCKRPLFVDRYDSEHGLILKIAPYCHCGAKMTVRGTRNENN